MKQGEIIEMAKQARLMDTWDGYVSANVYRASGVIFDDLKVFAELVEEKVTARYMQLFLDPENQPTQFGTATEEYREQELKEAKTLLKELAHIVRTTHLYGPEMKKILEKEEVINGEASSSL